MSLRGSLTATDSMSTTRLHHVLMAGLNAEVGAREPTPRRPTLDQRLKKLTEGDLQKYKRWKVALKWAKERAEDHEVHTHVTDANGNTKEEKRTLFDKFLPSRALTYDDEQLTEMMEFFYFAREQYLAYL